MAEIVYLLEQVIDGFNLSLQWLTFDLTNEMTVHHSGICYKVKSIFIRFSAMYLKNCVLFFSQAQEKCASSLMTLLVLLQTAHNFIIAMSSPLNPSALHFFGFNNESVSISVVPPASG